MWEICDYYQYLEVAMRTFGHLSVKERWKATIKAQFAGFDVRLIDYVSIAIETVFQLDITGNFKCIVQKL